VVAVLFATLAAFLFVALLGASLWGHRSGSRVELLQATAKQLFSGAAEHDWLERLSAADGRVVVAYLLRTLPDVEAGTAERVRAVLRRSSVAGRELARLNARSALRRAEACRILGGLGETGAIPRLIELLRDRDPVVRREAVGALADLRAVETLPAIAAAREETDGWGDLLAIITLVRMGPGCVPHIGALLASPRSPGMTKALLQVTTQLRATTDPGLIRSLAGHPEMEVRVEALRALGALGPDPESVAVCLAAMDDPEWPTRALAASSLGRLGERGAIPRLEQAMGDPAYWVRHHVAEAIAGMGEAGKAALTRGLEHANPFVRDMSAQALYMRSARGGRAA
jgi:HEAT repeat protein